MRCVALLLGFLGLTAALPTDNSISATSTGAISKSEASPVYLPPIPFGGRELHNLTIDPLTGTVNDEVFSAASNLRCETSGASPLTRNIQLIENLLKQTNRPCFQFNAGGSRCTKVGGWADAEIGLCGAWYYSVGCFWTGYAAQQIREKCAHGGRAGGTWTFDSHLRTIVY